MALIKEHLNIDAVITSGKTSQFEVIANGQTIAQRGGNWFTRSFGAGYPNLDTVLQHLKTLLALEANDK